MNKELFTLLTKVDTPTVSNAIEVALGQRGYNNFTKVQCFVPILKLVP